MRVKAYMKNDEISAERSDEIHQRTGFSDRRYRRLIKTNCLKIYETGSGKIKIRGKVEVEKLKGGKSQPCDHRDPVYDDRSQYRKIFK